MRMFTWLLGCVLAWSVSGAELHFDLSDYDYGSTPTNFDSVLAGGGAPGAWKIITADAPSAFAPLGTNAQAMNRSKVLAQTSEDMTDEHFPMFIYGGETFRDFTFSTKFKIVSGISEQMAGLVFRFQNVSNFYVVRVSAAGQNVRFYKVVNGVRSDPIGPLLAVPAGEWHKLAVRCDGNQIMVYLDNRLIMPTLNDNTFGEGKLGFWTKSDSVTYFTDAGVDYTPRIPPAQSMIDTVLQTESKLAGLRIYTLDTNNVPHIIASKDKSEIGQTGTDAEVQAIQKGSVFFGREHGVSNVTLPLHDRNGDYIGAVRVKTKSLFGESQDTAVTRAMVIQRMLEQYCPNGDELQK